MASIAWSDVVAFAPDQSAVSATAQTKILAYVNERFDVSELGGESSPDLYMARVWLAAHLGASTALGGDVAGPVTSESAGGLSRSYAVLSSTGALATTGYGAQLKELIRACCGGARLVQ